MDTITIDKMIARYGLVSDQVDVRELTVLLRELVKTLPAVDGDVVEFGCYRGTTSLYIRRVLDVLAPDRALHVYDSFEGLPEKVSQDRSPAGEQFKAGELRVSKKDLIVEFKKAGLRLPFIHKGWFNEIIDEAVPDKIAFAFLDGDYYESIRDSLKLIEHKLVSGAVIVVDDYTNEALPGAARAVDEWMAQNPGWKLRIVSSLAIITR